MDAAPPTVSERRDARELTSERPTPGDASGRDVNYGRHRRRPWAGRRRGVKGHVKWKEGQGKGVGRQVVVDGEEEREGRMGCKFFEITLKNYYIILELKEDLLQ